MVRDGNGSAKPQIFKIWGFLFYVVLVYLNLMVRMVRDGTGPEWIGVERTNPRCKNLGFLFFTIALNCLFLYFTFSGGERRGMERNGLDWKGF